MAAAAERSQTVPSSEETASRPDWLIDMMEKQQKEPLIETKEGQEQQTRPETLIEKVDNELYECFQDRAQKHFYPSVVSFGPYHSSARWPMDTNKEVAAHWFISLATDKRAKRITEDDVIEVYQKFLNKVATLSPEYRDWFPGWCNPMWRGQTLRDCKDPRMNHIDWMNDEDRMRMMFLDGCFLLNFIHLVADRSDRTSGLYKCSSHLNQPAIIRDMFLLENQIPYTVLKALMSLTGNESFHRKLIIQFISMAFLPSCQFHISLIGCIRVLFSTLKESFTPTRKDDVDTEPHHLLDLLRAILIGRGASPSSPRSGYWYHCFRPIRELKAGGIQVRRSNSISLKDVKFKQGPLNSHLEIPPIIVDHFTKTRLLNLVAYEKCSNGQKDRTVTSYICFLGSLIYDVDDVKELQSKNILLNRLSSNDDVVKLFRDFATHLSPDCNAYGDVIEGIDLHFKRNFNRQRVRIGEWIGQFIRIYFTSPWTVASLIAAFVLLLLTLLQTIYTIGGFYKTS